jgi:hypothetical protein
VAKEIEDKLRAVFAAKMAGAAPPVAEEMEEA